MGTLGSATVLDPAGCLAAGWQCAGTQAQPPPDVAQALAAVYRRVMPDSLAARGSTMPAVDGYSMLGTKAAEGIHEAWAFSEPEKWRFDW